MLSVHHKTQLGDLLSRALNTQGQITNLKSEGGGCINETWCFEFGDQKFFLKKNAKEEFPEMFLKESNGLKELSKCRSLVIPRPVLIGEIEDSQFLVLEYLEKAADTDDYFGRLGQALADLHRITAKEFGLEESNYIGSLVQNNDKTSSWHEFFALHRLEPLVKWAYDEKYIQASVVRSFESLYQSIDSIFPNEQPSLLHGDLWSGNKMNTVTGPSIFDPAVYYGHREMDIAMTRLFGGFSPAFYEAYNAVFPLKKGYSQRTDICNLYPLLVHVKLFGTGYLGDVLRIIKRF